VAQLEVGQRPQPLPDGPVEPVAAELPGLDPRGVLRMNPERVRPERGAAPVVAGRRGRTLGEQAGEQLLDDELSALEQHVQVIRLRHADGEATIWARRATVHEDHGGITPRQGMGCQEPGDACAQDHNLRTRE
jgi:hypothetical protein